MTWSDGTICRQPRRGWPMPTRAVAFPCSARALTRDVPTPSARVTPTSTPAWVDLNRGSPARLASEPPVAEPLCRRLGIAYPAQIRLRKSMASSARRARSATSGSPRCRRERLSRSGLRESRLLGRLDLVGRRPVARTRGVPEPPSNQGRFQDREWGFLSADGRRVATDLWRRSVRSPAHDAGEPGELDLGTSSGRVRVERFVSPEVTVGGAGTVDDPWPLTSGLAKVAAGDVLFLRGGSYAGNFTMNGRRAPRPSRSSSDRFPASMRSSTGPTRRCGCRTRCGMPSVIPTSVCTSPTTRSPTAATRRPAVVLRPGSVHAADHELDPRRPQRLQRVVRPSHPCGPTSRPEARTRQKSFPWVYLGPGLFQDPITGIVSVRLAHTTLNVPGFPDYTGPTDPNQVPLAIWTATVPVLKIINCASVHISDLTVRHGRVCVRIEKSNDIRLDHLNIYAGSYGIEFADQCTDAVVTHCLVDGGAPPWHYRSDRKTSYTFLDTDGVQKTNNLGVNTAKSLLGGSRFCSGTTIRYCELVNGHDLYLFGAGSMLERCFISNLNDDAIFAETRGAPGVRIFENVITRALMAINFALQGDTEGTTVDVYRNLIDLRSPTARFRPQPNPPDGFSPVVTGQLFKSNSPDSPLTLFHNTCIVANREFVTSYPHLRARTRASRHATRSTTSSSPSTPPPPPNCRSLCCPIRPSRRAPTATATYVSARSPPDHCSAIAPTSTTPHPTPTHQKPSTRSTSCAATRPRTLRSSRASTSCTARNCTHPATKRAASPPTRCSAASTPATESLPTATTSVYTCTARHAAMA